VRRGGFGRDGLEAESGVRLAAFVVHADERGDEDVEVVVDFDTDLGVGGPQNPSDVLDDAAFELDREREEQGVQGWAVEPFAEQAGSRDK
jgi:predicted TIM-barrel fold metal-dependent hydrolase